jgi:hypothetical protein
LATVANYTDGPPLELSNDDFDTLAEEAVYGARTDKRVGWPRRKQQALTLIYHVFLGMPKTRAALKAGYSPTHAASIHNRLKQYEPYVQHLRITRREIIRQKFAVTVDTVASGLAAQAFANLRDFYEPVVLEDGSTFALGRCPTELPAESQVAVKRVKPAEIVTLSSGRRMRHYQYYFHDRFNSLQALGRYLGMFNEELQKEIALERRRTQTRAQEVDLRKVSSSKLKSLLSQLRQELNASVGSTSAEEPLEAQFEELRREEEMHEEEGEGDAGWTPFEEPGPPRAAQ